VGGLAHHLEVVGGVDEHVEPGADQRLVVREQDPDHGRAPSCSACSACAATVPPRGSRAATRKPPAGPGPASTVPPTAAARSRIPASPWPSPFPAMTAW